MEEILAKDSIPFQAEGRLLQELGLRLVASPEVALVELIKNSYDADSPTCCVRLADNEKTLVVADSRTPDIDPAIPCYFRAFSVF